LERAASQRQYPGSSAGHAGRSPGDGARSDVDTTAVPRTQNDRRGPTLILFDL